MVCAEEGRPIGSAALIKQSDGSGVGRAVSLHKSVGGLLMLMAVADHLAPTTPVVAGEVSIISLAFPLERQPKLSVLNIWV